MDDNSPTILLDQSLELSTSTLNRGLDLVIPSEHPRHLPVRLDPRHLPRDLLKILLGKVRTVQEPLPLVCVQAQVLHATTGCVHLELVFVDILGIVLVVVPIDGEGRAV